MLWLPRPSGDTGPWRAPARSFVFSRNASVLAAALDLVCVSAFATIGRLSHHEPMSFGAIFETAWPFLIGLILAWTVSARMVPATAPWPRGVAIFLGTWGLGMLQHWVAPLGGAWSFGVPDSVHHGGPAFAFVLVSAGFLAATLLGWRLLVTLLARRPRQAPLSSPRPPSVPGQ